MSLLDAVEKHQKKTSILKEISFLFLFIFNAASYFLGIVVFTYLLRFGLKVFGQFKGTINYLDKIIYLYLKRYFWDKIKPLTFLVLFPVMFSFHTIIQVFLMIYYLLIFNIGYLINFIKGFFNFSHYRKCVNIQKNSFFVVKVFSGLFRQKFINFVCEKEFKDISNLTIALIKEKKELTDQADKIIKAREMKYELLTLCQTSGDKLNSEASQNRINSLNKKYYYIIDKAIPLLNNEIDKMSFKKLELNSYYGSIYFKMVFYTSISLIALISIIEFIFNLFLIINYLK